MWLGLLTIFLCFSPSLLRPIGDENNENSEYSPPAKKPKFEAEGNQICYFNKERKNDLYEKKDRPPLSIVSTTCSSVMKSFSELSKIKTDFVTKLGAENDAALIFARGSGEFFIDWNDQNEVNNINELWICEKHYKELLSQWESPTHLKYKRKEKACSMFATPSIPHAFYVKAGHSVLKFEEAKAIMVVNGTLAHVGIPLCDKHHNLVKATKELYYKTKEKEKCVEPADSTPETTDVPTNDADSLSRRAKEKAKLLIAETSKDEPQNDDENALRKAFNNFLKALGIDPSSTTKPWHFLSVTAKYRYIDLYKRIDDKVAAMLVGTLNKNKLRESSLNTHSNTQVNIVNPVQHEMLEEFKKFYNHANSKMESRAYLSLIADVIPYNVIEKFIPGLSEKEYFQAKKMARRTKAGLKAYPRVYRQIVPTAEIESFVGFFTGETISTSIPFGNIKTKLSNNKVVSVPATVREWTATRIIQMYKNFKAALGQTVSVSDSTLRKILEACPAKKQVSLQALDQFKADGIQAFGWLTDLIKKMKDMALIDKAKFDEYKTNLTEAEFFLKHDFFTLLQPDHHSGDLCLSYALSDPRTPEYKAEKCNEKTQHLYKINRAYTLQGLMEDIKKQIASFEEEQVAEEPNVEIEDMKITLEECESAINKWKNHIVRSKFSSITRKDIIDNLKNGEAVVTIDFSQKWIPRKYLETQSDYFGRAGLSMHIIHCIFMQHGTLLQHTIVHFLGYADQDYVTVAALLANGFKMLADNHVRELTIRSDNAGYYRNPALLYSIPKIAAKAGLTVKRYSFSEPQAGKSTADVETARLKGIIRQHLNAGHDVATQKQMFDAINEAVKANMVDGITAVYAGTVPIQNEKPKFTLPDTQFISDVEYSEESENVKRIRIWKHYKLGKGKLVDITNQVENLDVKELSNVEYSQKTILFWREKENILKNEKLIESEPVLEQHDLHHSDNEENKKFFRCEIDGCTKEYLTKEGLEKHKLRGDHHILPMKETLDERSYEIFYKYTSGIKTKHDLFVDSFLSLDDFNVDENQVPDEGWALRRSSTRTKYTKEMEQFLQNQYKIFTASGQRRVDAYNVQKLMRASRNPLFKANERLSASQLASYFTTRHKKQTKKQKTRITPLSEDDEQYILEQTLEEMDDDPNFSRRYQNDPAHLNEEEEITQHIITNAQNDPQTIVIDPRSVVLPDAEDD